jgi:hypothetical protein
VTELESLLRVSAYRVTLARGSPPTVSELAVSCAASEAEVRDGLRNLTAARMLVVQPTSGELLMVPPFSSVPTPFAVRTAHYTTYANCIWDALGVPVMLREPAEIVTACGCCSESSIIRAHRDAPPDGRGVVHFAVPARRWWDDVVFT